MTSISAATADLNSHGVAYAPQIASAAARHGLDPRLLAAVAAQETGGPGTNAGANIDGDGGHGHGVEARQGRLGEARGLRRRLGRAGQGRGAGRHGLAWRR